LNYPEDIQQVYALMDQDVDAMKDLMLEEKFNLKVRLVAKLRDALLKGFIASGFPKVSVK
jgi:hypothetical protein